MQPCNYYQTHFCKIYKVKWGTSISATLHICDLVAHLTVFNGRTSDSRTLEKNDFKMQPL